MYGDPWFAPGKRDASLQLTEAALNDEETAMANDWTRLLQEAAKRRGPEGLRTHYRVTGQLQGIAYVTLGMGLSVAYRKTREHFAKPATPAAPPQPSPRASGASDEGSEPHRPESSRG
ncbi:hypothetical protein A6A22_09370 [Arthrobacter sp. OY3WO11]|nr:hypothetical protein A6A22_09370 [Arthrobacter sp. OY3WO11]